jgi:hypothetical protein
MIAIIIKIDFWRPLLSGAAEGGGWEDEERW